MALWDALHIPYRAHRFRRRGEPESVAWLLAQDLAGATCLDIGAHKGAFTYWMCRAAGPRGRVIGFEPQPELHRYLERCHRHFRHANLQFAGVGLSNQSGTLTLVRRGKDWGGAGFYECSDANAERINVPVFTLDDYIAAHDVTQVRLIKCDVEGHEEAVFRGAERLLLRDRPQLLFEGHNHIVGDGSLFHYLQSLGYDGHFFAQQGLHPLAERGRLLDRDMTNYVFTPRVKCAAQAA